MGYWQDRLIKAQDVISNKTIRQIEKQLTKYYQEVGKNVIDEFENTYNKLLATIEDGKEPTPADLYKLDKYWELQAQTRQKLRELGEKEVSLLTKYFELDFFDIYYSIDIEGLTTFNTLDEAAVQQMINGIWVADAKTWSDRIWKNTEYLLETLNEQLIHTVATGKKPTELKKLLQERFSVSYQQADTLVRTEVSHIQTVAAEKRYKDYGLEQYEYLGRDQHEKELKCKCKELNGKKFFYHDPSAPRPPLHPNCRCSIIPVVEIEI